MESLYSSSETLKPDDDARVAHVDPDLEKLTAELAALDARERTTR
jgi:hypothetical protein